MRNKACLEFTTKLHQCQNVMRVGNQRGLRLNHCTSPYHSNGKRKKMKPRDFLNETSISKFFAVQKTYKTSFCSSAPDPCRWIDRSSGRAEQKNRFGQLVVLFVSRAQLKLLEPLEVTRLHKALKTSCSKEINTSNTPAPEGNQYTNRVALHCNRLQKLLKT